MSLDLKAGLMVMASVGAVTRIMRPASDVSQEDKTGRLALERLKRSLTELPLSEIAKRPRQRKVRP